MTDTEKLSLAMDAIEEADGIVSQTFFPHGDCGDWYCECWFCGVCFGSSNF